MKNIVKTEDLKENLLEEKESFAPWDDGRRTKVDIVLESIERNEKDASLSTLQETIFQIIIENRNLEELKDSAVKMLRIHYLRLARTDAEKKEYAMRKEMALKKLERYTKEHNINL